MGGSGGDRNWDPSKLRENIRDLERGISDPEYEKEVSQLLSSVLAFANDRDSEAVTRHLADIKAALEKEIDGVVNLLFGGSVAKHTYIDGVSDVDALVVLNESELANASPREVRDYFVERLRERLQGSSVEPDGFAVTIKYADVEVQLVPVRKNGDLYILPSDDLRSWNTTRPRSFTDELTATNRACNGKLIPTVKLAKVLMDSLPEDRRPSGYHLESLALEVFRTYEESSAPKAMLLHFFNKAPERVLTPIPDLTGQSSNVDDSLGPEMSLERRLVSDAMARVGRRLRNADGARSSERWKSLFDGD